MKSWENQRKWKRIKYKREQQKWKKKMNENQIILKTHRKGINDFKNVW